MVAVKLWSTRRASQISVERPAFAAGLPHRCIFSRGAMAGDGEKDEREGGVAPLPRCPPNLSFQRFAALTGPRRRGTVAFSLPDRAGGAEGAMFVRIACGALALALGLVCSSEPRAASWDEKNFWLSGPRYDRVIPTCDFGPALDRIMANFRTKEARFWNSELQIVGIEDIRETAVLPWAAQSVPRRFCAGMALINDGLRHAIYYSIGEDTGMIGMDWGVNFCVAGLDRDWEYGPACRAAKP